MINLNYKRRKTVPVNIGQVPLGSDYPIRVQTMANTLTSDTENSVAQCIRVAEAGADYVRFTVPSHGDIQSLAEIRKKLRKKGYQIPIIADVHFNADIAVGVTQASDKVRINPGNFAGAAKYDEVNISDEAYNQGFVELERKFIPLLEKCLQLGVALRIGVNHGSLSGRIMNRFGDTPAGMAESAMEFLRICKAKNFNQVVVSMKASNVRIMVHATRLLVKMMDEAEMPYPVHLGVTEAGEGEDGRIKSAAGIGALLGEGIGDTVRISLTEDPELEIPVGLKLIRHIAKLAHHQLLPDIRSLPANPFLFDRRITNAIGNIGGQNVPVVIGEAGMADFIFKQTFQEADDNPEPKNRILPYKEWLECESPDVYPYMTADLYFSGNFNPASINFVQMHAPDIGRLIAVVQAGFSPVIVYECSNVNIQAELKWLYSVLKENGCRLPVIIGLHYREEDSESLQVISAADAGGSFIDGFGDGLWITNDGPVSPETIVSVSFSILQSCRARITHTEYISCPSCGRTNFNLQEILSRIKEATSHLKTLKIGVMGCIVNGPGEMADADYGYVGAGKGKVTLYKAKQVVKRGIPETSAVDELVALIKENGDWTDA